MSIKKIPDKEVQTLTGKDYIALTCFFISGFTGLVYEICWIRKASLIFGTTIFALSTVVAVFFAGMALGSYLFGKYTVKTSQPLKCYAFLEIGLGITILVNPALFSLFNKLYGLLYPFVFQNFIILSLTRLLFIAVLLLPPTILIGGTLPLFCKQYVNDSRKILLSVGRLYGLNTLGAVIGTVVCGFILIPRIGVNEAIWLCGILNISIGIIVIQLRLSAFVPVQVEDIVHDNKNQSPAEANAIQTHSLSTNDSILIAILFFFSGFVALGNEIIWSRYLSLIIHNTVYTYTLTLAVILTGIFSGSMVISFFPVHTYRRVAFIFSLLHILIGLSVTQVLMVPADFWKNVIDTQNVPTLLWVSTVIFLFPSILAGMSFPLAIRMVVNRPHHAGIGVGRMSAINTVGGILGSLGIGFIALPLLGLHKSVIMTTGMSLCIGFIAIIFLNRTVHSAVKSLIIGLTLIIWTAIPYTTGTKLPADFLVEKLKLIDFREGINSFLAVIENEEDNLILEIDRMWQGGKEKGHQIMAAHVPMLLHQNPRKILSIGVGVGQTASRFLYYDMQQLDCVEIEKELFAILRKHFDSEWMDDKRVRLIIEDGRNFVSHTNDTYDVISIEIGQIFRPNLTSFYTVEFYQCVFEKLHNDGIVSQFVPLAFVGKREFLSIIRTFLEVFPESVLWYNRNELLIIGSKSIQPKLTYKRLALLSSDSTVNRDLRYYFWGGVQNRLNKPEVFTAGFLCGPETLKKISRKFLVYHDNKPVLEYQSAKNQKYSIKDVIQKTELLKTYIDPLHSILHEKMHDTIISDIAYIRDFNLNDNIAMELYMTFLSNNDVSQLIKAYTSNPYNIDITFKMGVVAAKEGNKPAAEKYYKEVIAIDSSHVDAYNNLGLLYADQGRFSEAISQYVKAIRLDPAHFKAFNNLGVSYAQQGRMKEAESCFLKALTIKPAFQDARSNLELCRRYLKN